MNRIIKLSALAGITILFAHSDLLGQAAAQSSRDVLWYRSPAPIWDHALPVGNGRLGAMVFGGANSGKNNGESSFPVRTLPCWMGRGPRARMNTCN